jgi:hypothetical protein
MPRGVKGSKNYDAEIEVIDAKIERYKGLIRTLEAKKDALVAGKQNLEMQSIYDYLQQSGLSPEQALNKLRVE